MHFNRKRKKNTEDAKIKMHFWLQRNEKSIKRIHK